MEYKNLNRVLGLLVFLIATFVYVMTVQPTFSLWDCGEFIASAYTLGVPHPPGAPFFLLLGKLFTLIPLASDIGLRMNYLSVFASAGSVALLYLICTKVILDWRGTAESASDLLIICGSSFVGALALAFSDTFWFNALESEVYGLGTFLITLSLYVLMLWWERADEEGSDRYLLLVAFIVGLSLGIHLIVAQMIFVGGILFYFRRYEYSFKGFIIAVILSAIAFFVVYPIMVIRLPQLLDVSLIIGVMLILTLLIGIYFTSKYQNKATNLALVSIFLIIVGYSTYTMVILRANVDDLPINENAPKDLTTLVSYLSREQYGDQPLLFPRRHSNEPMHQRTWNNYSSDLDFMWKYQINEMFNRYLFWNFIGREGRDQGDGVDFSKLWAIPFLFGMLGIFYHFRKNWKLALVLLIMFLVMGVLTALYQNQQDPQPRERDYFYVGAFLVFAMWIAFGVAAIIEQISNSMKSKKSSVAIVSILLIASIIAIPVNMIRANYHYHDRSENYVPFDYAYNILQTLEKDAILFTNGDNDTFTLWAIQAVYGIRQDVRVINLSLAQMPWYNLQLKNEKPYGALTVPMTYTDEQLENLRPVQWPEEKPVKLEVPEWAYPDTLAMKPGEINFNMPATIRQNYNGQTITAVNSSDLIILDILKANNWQRPVYFCITVTSDNFIGLEDYISLNGMAYRIMPYKVGSSTSIAIDEKVMRDCLFNIPNKFYTQPYYGYSFRGLNNNEIFFTEDQRRMIETYRTLYINLAKYYSDNPETFELARQSLDEMNKRIPYSVVPMDYRVKYDVAMIYYKIDEKDKFNWYSSDIEREALKMIDKNPTAISGFYSPYRILVDLYETNMQYDKAINVLNRMASINPTDPNIRAKIEDLKNRKSDKENNSGNGEN